MTTLQFSSGVKSVAKMDPGIRREDCMKAAREYLQSDDFTLEKCLVQTSEITGITGRYYKIFALVRSEGRMQEIHLFAKTPPILKSQRVFVVDYKYFHREIVFYDYMVPDMIASLPQGVVFPLPRCVLTRDSLEPGFVPVPGSVEEELIVLEDVTHRGFCRRKSRVMDLQHCHVALKSMARFHAASILLALRRRKDVAAYPTSTSNGAPDLSDELWNLDYEKSFVTRSTESTATAVCAMWLQKFSGRRGEILGSLSEAWAKFHSLARNNPKYVKAFVEGDAWGDNFMFSYEVGSDGNGKPVDTILVDMQLVQFLPPIYDVIFFLHVSVRKSFRDLNVPKFLEIYHEELTKSMPPGLCDSVLPFKSFMESYEDLKTVGPLISSAYLPKILEWTLSDDIRRDPEDRIGDLLNDRGERIAYYCEKSPFYREWVEESYKECLEVLGFSE